MVDLVDEGTVVLSEGGLQWASVSATASLPARRPVSTNGSEGAEIQGWVRICQQST